MPAAVCMVAVVDAAVARTAGRLPAAFYVLEIGTAAVWTGVGVLAAVIRPDRRAGWLMQVLGLVLMVDAPAGFALAGEEAWVAADLVVARSVQPLQIALFSHLLLSYPEGRLRRAAERGIVAAVYCFAAMVGVATAIDTARLVTEPGWGDAVPPAGIAGGGSSPVVNLVWLSLAVVYLALLIDKVRRATRRRRRVLAYPFGAGVLLMLLFLVTTGFAAVDGQSPTTGLLSAVLAYLAVLAMPGAFLAGLLRERLSYGSVAEFLRTLEYAPVRQLQAALRKALRDPGLEVAFARADGYVDEGGRAVSLPGGDGRAVLNIGGEPPIAVVLHDASLTDEPKLLTAASSATRLALDNARLHELVREQLSEVRASRWRIIEAGVEQRRRIERDLHDGAQQRMLAVGIALRLLRQRLGHGEPGAVALLEEAQRELQAAVEELRELARGIHPAVLTDQGLSAAVRALARRLPIPVAIDDALSRRLHPAVEAAAYFTVGEALSNVVKHSAATTARVGLSLTGDRLRVEVVDDGVGGADPALGSGLQGLADRAAAFDGSLSVTPASPTGTRLVVELRCG
ncbi:sensor histidine kinase [Streptosporangium roseum]|uniref:sensor histidine kinase n=1 Tax=Streptosporangium roseum TaxID=2001 RepID=UPI0033172E3C